MNRRVVITGMGIYSTIGKSLDEVKNSLFEGKSGIIYSPERKEFGYRSALTGWVENPDLKDLLARRQRVTMGQESEFAYMATIEAIRNAGIDQDFFNNNEVGYFTEMIVFQKLLFLPQIKSERRKILHSLVLELFSKQ